MLLNLLLNKHLQFLFDPLHVVNHLGQFFDKVSRHLSIRLHVVMALELKDNFFGLVDHVQESLKISIVRSVDSKHGEPFIGIIKADTGDKVVNYTMHGLFAFLSD